MRAPAVPSNPRIESKTPLVGGVAPSPRTSCARPQAILFDWDNTLVDGWSAVTDALNAALEAFDHPRWTLAETKARVRRSLRDSFPDMFGSRWQEAQAIFYRRFEAGHLDCLKEMPGASAALIEISAIGVPIAVVSNKQGRLLRAEAAHLGWEGRFRRLVGATDAPRDKPARDPVDLALSAIDVAAGPGVWFVGDAAVDMACAHAAGCLPVLLRAEADRIDETEEFQRFPPTLRIPDLTRLAVLLRDL